MRYRSGERGTMEKKRLQYELKKYFGYKEFRIGQLEIITSVLSGKNTLAILATGGGKSICYQLPALILPGITLVISPLISLMVDQVRQLKGKGIQTVEYINSSLTTMEYQEKLKKVREGKIKILYLSPEKLQQDSFLQMVCQYSISLFVVDEAHCISQWGHDFRTDYQRLLDRVHKLGDPTVLALTATATPGVQRDICQQLNIPEHHIMKQSVNRKNICYEVAFVKDDHEKIERLLEWISKLDGPGIVYFRSRQGAERAAKMASEGGIGRCAFYHGGMEGEERFLIQQQFLLNELQIIFATNAFGMGIDKPDVRFVIHYHMPPDMESYIQEVGRVGRDGRPGYACLLYSQDDVFLPGQLIQEEYPDRQQIDDFLADFSAISAGFFTLEEEKAKMNWGLREQQITVLLYHLEQSGHITGIEKRPGSWRFVRSSVHNLSSEKLAATMSRRQQDRLRRLRDFQQWVENESCRREGIARYFQEDEFTSLASCCDQCGIDYFFYMNKIGKNPYEIQNGQNWNWQEELNRIFP